MPATLETIILFGEEIEEAVQSGKYLRAALTGSRPSERRDGCKPGQTQPFRGASNPSVPAEREDTKSQQQQPAEAP